MKRLLICLTVILIACLPGLAQQTTTAFKFEDMLTGLPVSKVTILDQKGAHIGESDEAGIVSLPSYLFDSGRYLLAVHHSYSIDTLTGGSENVVKLKHLAGELSEVEITGNKTIRLLNENNEFVVDYEIVGDKVVVATYSGNEGRHAKLFLIDEHGTELARTDVPGAPERMFRSCVGRHYCVCNNKFYPLIIDSNSISLRPPYDIKILAGMEQCDLSINGNLYYRRGDKVNFSIAYEMLAKNDSVMKPITSFSEPDVAYASMMDYFRILGLLGGGHFSDAAKLQMARRKWDAGSYSHINLPIFNSGSDTLVIFNYFKRRIEFYDLSGVPTGTCPIGFEWRQSQQFEILRDEPQNRFYIHRYGAPSGQTLEELNINTGRVSSPSIRLEKPFAEHVKVSNGTIYYLWQNSRAAATRQLFRQRMK